MLTFLPDVHDDGLVVRVRFALEAAPPRLDWNDRLRTGFEVDLLVDPVKLHRAADDWTRELNTLVSRPRPASGMT